MTLLVDATTAEHARGIGTVIDGLLTEASGVAPEGTIVATGPSATADWELPVERIGLARTRAGRILYQRALLPGHVAQLRAGGRRIDRVLVLDSYLPIVRPDPRVRYAVLIHDVLPLTHPHYWNPVERAVKRSAFLSLRHSKAHLFTSNQHNAHEIRRLLGRDAETVPFGCGQLTDAEADSALHSSLSIPGDTLVYVGALEPRKEVLFLLDLYEQFRRLGASLRLTLVGQGRGAYASLVEDRIATSQFRHDIEVVRSASRRTALQLIARARVLVVPSAAEGFGLPVVEAIALGTPVVAGRLPAIKSWADDSVTYAGVGVEEWVDAIALACEMSEVERRRRQTAVRTHRWRNCAAAMFDF